MDEKLQETIAALKDFLGPDLLTQKLGANVPESLCHYTDFVGLKGILESKKIWATFNRTTNDGSEEAFGDAVMKHICAQFPNDAQVDVQNEKGYRTFVSSFCTSSQILSMWVTYASRGGGFCLEFSGSGGIEQVQKGIPNSFLFKVLYGKEAENTFTNLIPKVLEFAKKGDAERNLASSLISILSLLIKHPAFILEQEWRLLVRNPSLETLCFRQGHADVKPYVELDVAMPDGKLPLKRIVFGPTLRHDPALVESLRLMLLKYGYSNIPIVPCGIPYRL